MEKNNWIVFLFIIFGAGCTTVMPPIDVSFWAGDSAQAAISRAQEKKSIACHEPEFDQYVCLTYTDVAKIYQTLLQCKDWSTPTMSITQAKEFLRKNKDAYKAFETHATIQ